MAVRHGSPATLSLERTATQPSHFRGEAGLIHEDQLLRVQIRLFLKPAQPFQEYIGAILLAGVRRLFLYVILRRSSQ